MAFRYAWRAGDIVRTSPAPARMATPKRERARVPEFAAPLSSARIPALASGEREPGHGAALVPLLRDGTKGAGQPLGAALRASFGASLLTDFRDVRIHTDEAAARSADSLGAQAYTVGRDIVFGAGRYQPETDGGQRLLAHELVHVAQPPGHAARAVSRPTDASEQEAHHAADAVMKSQSIRPQAAAGALVQREPVHGADPAGPGTMLDRMLDRASPFLAASVGSTTLSGFDTGKSELKPAHLAELKRTASNIVTLLRQYPQSTVTVTGHTDTVGTEANNLELGRARALETANALDRLGVPADIVTALSAGEAGPQAARTRDETPDARNRRVEVRFEPKALPSAGPAPKLELKERDKQPAPPPVDLNYHPPADRVPPDRRDDSPSGMWKPLPPMPKGAGPKSPLDVIGEKLIDPVVDAVAHGLSKDIRDTIKEKARAGVKAGVAKLARTAAERAGVTDSTALDAIEKATEAAIQEKDRASP